MTFAILNLPCKTVVLKFFMYVVLLSIWISKSDLVVSFTQEYRSAVFLWKIVFGIPNEHTQSHSSFTAAHQTSIQLGAVGMWTRPTGARWRAGFRCGDTHGSLMEIVGVPVLMGSGATTRPAYSSAPLGDFLFLSKSRQQEQ